MLNPARPGNIVEAMQSHQRTAVMMHPSAAALAYASGMRAMGREWVRGMVHPRRLHDTALIEPLMGMLYRQTPHTFAAQIRALLDRPDAGDVLPTIACPTMLVCGRQDAWSPLVRHEAMATQIPRCQLEVVEECGHMSTMEQPSNISALMQRWLCK